MDQNFIEVVGKATLKVVPDLIYLRIQISEKQKYRIDMDKKEQKMLESLQNLNIPEKDIVIKDLASNFKPMVFSDDDIVVSKVLMLLVHDGKTANKVISEMEKLKISNIRVDRLDHSKMPDLKQECSVAAMSASKSKAESLAKSIGQNIGRALYIEEREPTPMMMENDRSRYAYKAETATSSDWFITDLDFDEMTIEYSVLARYELK
jgi:uncharacterized protein YggE